MKVSIDLRDLSREQLIRLVALLAEERSVEDPARCREVAERCLSKLANDSEDVAFLTATQTIRETIAPPTSTKA